MNLGTAKYGMPTLAPATATAGAGASNGIVATERGFSGRLDPENPMLWLLGIGAVTLGLVAASTSVRVGPVKVSASAGK